MSDEASTLFDASPLVPIPQSKERPRNQPQEQQRDGDCLINRVIVAEHQPSTDTPNRRHREAPNAKSTAKRGNPRAASRGAAVERAKAALGDAIDARLALDIEKMELALLAEVAGLPPAEIRAALDKASIDDVERWRAAVESSLPEAATGCGGIQ